MALVCSKCRMKPPTTYGRYCGDCHNAYMREWRKTHRLEGEAKKRDAARSYANVYRKRGKLIPCACQACGHIDAQMHHPDHELPLEVVWLCRPCHLLWHEYWRDVARRTFVAWLEAAKSFQRAA